MARIDSFASGARCLLLALTLSFAPAAIAQTTSLPRDAQDALKNGLAAASALQWETAIQNFQDARKIAPDAPEIYYDLGLAESKIPGRELRAIAWLGGYLAAAPQAPNTAAIKNFIAELQTRADANIERLIKATDVADSLLPDTPIRHDGGLTGKLTNKPDQDRSMSLYEVANLWAASGKPANAVQTARRIGQAGYNEAYSLSQIVAAQAGAGHITDAIKTAAGLTDEVWSATAKLAIADGQAKAGDLAGARTTLTTAQQSAAALKSVYVKNSQTLDIVQAQANIGDISGAQKTAQMIPSPSGRGSAQLAIASAQTKAGDVAGARASLAIAQKSADLWNSMTVAQKKAGCGCQPSEPQDQTSLTYMEYRIGKMFAEAGEVAGARSALRLAQKYARLISSLSTKSSQSSNIAEAQAHAGDITDAQETAKLISEAIWKRSAAMEIAKAQANAGDVAGAQKTIAALNDPSAANQAKYIIADAQAKRAAPTQVSLSAAPQPPAASPAVAAQPAVSAADWIREVDTLNTPLFLDLPGSLKAPRQAYKAIYPGSTDSPTDTESKKTFDALVAISRNIISAKNTIDQMLKRQFVQATNP